MVYGLSSISSSLRIKTASLPIQAFLPCTSGYSLYYYYYTASIACSYSLYASDGRFHYLCFLWGVEFSMVSLPSSGIDEMSRELTPLQKHVQFFDRNDDGIVYPQETYQGFRAIGFGVCFSALSALFINTALSSRTLPTGQKPSFSFPIYIRNIKRARHGSDSGVYDEEGRFVDWKFEELFRKHALTHAHSLTSNELSQLLKANREPKDYKGWIGGFTEWKTLYQLCKDENGLLHKDDIRAAYDGTLFHRIEKQRISDALNK